MDIPIPTFMWKRNTQELPRTLWNRRMMRGAPPVIYQDIQQRYKKSKEDIMGEGEENIVQQGKDITLDKTKGKPAKKKCWV